MESPAPCPSEESFGLFIVGEHPQPETMEQHVDACAACRALLVGLAQAFFSDVAPDSAGLRPPALSVIMSRYELQTPIGVGAMGTVYSAWDPVLRRQLAIKLITARSDRSDVLAEARAQAAVQHPNVLPVYDAGIDETEVFVAMALVLPGPGREESSLRGRMPSAPLAQKLSWLRDAARGLAAAHAAGIAHRDFKPENVLIDDDGARVCDFGLARRSSATEAISTSDREAPISGTPAYLAPEQVRGARGDARSDQYAFGVVLFECVYGHHPHRCGEPGGPVSLRALGEAIAKGVKLPKAPAPAWLREVLARTLDADPDRRFRDMGEVAERLEGPTPAAQRWLQVAKVSLGLAALGHSALIIGMVLVALRPQDFPADSADAQGLRDSLLVVWVTAGLPLSVAALVGLRQGQRWAYGLTMLYALLSLPTCIGAPIAVPLLLAIAHGDVRRAFGLRGGRAKASASV